MSNFTRQCEQDCDTESGCDALELIIRPKEKDLGGFSVRRLLPVRERRMVGPWIFFDHMGPARFAAGEGINVRPHPHIGIATVTYLFEGEILHRDSLGSYQPIRPGDINLMVAGRGIVHSERERPEVTASEHVLHGLQLWLALPEAAEEVEPAFHHYPASDVPTVLIGEVPVRVMIGSAYGVTSPVATFAETLYLEADLEPGQLLELPDCAERAVYVASGDVSIGGSRLERYAMAVLSPRAGVTIEALGESRIALIGGESFSQRFIEWNFVSSSKARLEQAKADWQARRFPLVPGDEEEFIPLPQ